MLEPFAPPADDTDTAYYAPREGDLLMLALLLLVVLGTGGYVWHQLGGASSVGRAIFFGLFLFCILWAALVYTFKLSFGVVVGPHGISLTRGPWRTELAWSETARLVERTETHDVRRYRWVVAMAYDTRRLQVREDMVSDYDRFRQDVYLRYRNWQEHGGTWGTAASGPFTTRDEIRPQITWRLIGMFLCLLPGLYFLILLPETQLVGPVFLLGALICATLVVGTWLKRQTYSVDTHLVSSKRPLRPVTELRWRAVTKVERTRHPFGWLVRVGIFFGNGILELLARSDSRVRSFPWAPRVPEYLILRGAGHQVRFRLHRLARPDELLAWVEYYERIAQYAAQESGEAQASASPFNLESPEQSMPAPKPTDAWQGEPGAPADPWAATNVLGGNGADPRDGAATQPSAMRPPIPDLFPQPWQGDAEHAEGEQQPRARNATRPLRESQPLSGYTPISRPNFETEKHYATSAPGSEPNDEDDAWLRETQAHFRVSRPGGLPHLASMPPRGTQPPASTPPGASSQPGYDPGASSGPTSPTGPQPRHPDGVPTRPGRPRADTRPVHPQQAPRMPQPSQPLPPRGPAPYATRPPQPSQPAAPSRPGEPEHGDGFDQPSMDFQNAPPPQLPRFGPGTPDKRER